MGAVLAARDMAAEGCRTAVLDCRHHLQLTEADMAGIGSAPCRSMIAEDIRNLQSRARHKRSASAGWPDLLELERDVLQRAHDLTDRLGGDAGIERRDVELGVTEQHLDDADIDVLLDLVGGKAVPQGVQRDALLISAIWAAAWQARLSWRLVIGCAGSRPGNSQPCGRAAFHHVRSRSSRLGDSMTLRSLPPLPCSTRMIIRLLSMSEILSEITSVARRPAP
jgi:hypothetical protein